MFEFIGQLLVQLMLTNFVGLPSLLQPLADRCIVLLVDVDNYGLWSIQVRVLLLLYGKLKHPVNLVSGVPMVPE